MSYRIAIDVGGTFTDVVTFDNDTAEVSFHKVATTPDDPGRGILAGFEAAGVTVDDITHFVHGTTLGLNALLTRTGARTGIVTTRGFRDVYLLGRTDRRPMYDFTYRKPESLVQRYDIFEVPERLDHRGEVLVPFDEQEARRVAEQIGASGIASVAVCFLHAYANPSHERLMAAALAEVAPHVDVTISSDLSRELREYERTSTAVIDAYIKPQIRSYLDRLQRTLHDQGFRGQFLMTRSGGGAMSVRSAVAAPVNLVLSGPAGGLLGASWLAQATGEQNLITIDMGGTSIDVSLVIDGEPVRHYAAEFGGLPINVASLFINTIGAGGGSLGLARRRRPPARRAGKCGCPARSRVLRSRRHPPDFHRCRRAGRLSRQRLRPRRRPRTRHGWPRAGPSATSPAGSACPKRTSRPASSGSPRPRPWEPCVASPWSAATTPPTSPCWPSAAAAG